MKSALAATAIVLVSIATASPAAANEYSCTHAAAANGYVDAHYSGALSRIQLVGSGRKIKRDAAHIAGELAADALELL